MKVLKVVFSIIAISLILVACKDDPRAKLPATGNFGEQFKPDTQLLDVGKGLVMDSVQTETVQITGEIEKYCKGEGCWLTLKSGDSYIKVVTLDKKFILPKDITGKRVVAKGQFKESEKASGPRYFFEATGIIID